MPSRAISLYYGLMEELIHQYKFGKNYALAGYFAELIAEAYSEAYQGFLLQCIPPRRKKLRRQGWDQMELIQQILCKSYKIPFVQLLRRKDNLEQKSLNREERLAQQRFVLAARPKYLLKRYKLRGARVLVIDDVYTTGATMDGSARALEELREVGAISELRGLCLAAVP